MRQNNIPFLKMHGLGNDFVIVDQRAVDYSITSEQVQQIANRRLGVGCDQFIIIEKNTEAQALMHIFNSDGTKAGACGNATRCVAWLLLEESKNNSVCIMTPSGLTKGFRDGDHKVKIDMGKPRLSWQEIPLSQETNTLNMGISQDILANPVGVSMGNPHAVFFVDKVDQIPLEKLGPYFEHHPLFPERANIEIVEVEGPTSLRMRVWERGSGITPACGTGACASLVAAVRRKMIPGRKADLILDGGILNIEWREDDGHVMMAGPVAFSFSGTIPRL